MKTQKGSRAAGIGKAFRYSSVDSSPTAIMSKASSGRQNSSASCCRADCYAHASAQWASVHYRHEGVHLRHSLLPVVYRPISLWRCCAKEPLSITSADLPQTWCSEVPCPVFRISFRNMKNAVSPQALAMNVCKGSRRDRGLECERLPLSRGKTEGRTFLLRISERKQDSA